MQLCSRIYLTKKNTAESFGLGGGGLEQKRHRTLQGEEMGIMKLKFFKIKDK